MTEAAAFHSAINRDPADDTVRLVFADWLDEHDDPVRAAIIRAGIAHPEGVIAVFRRSLVSRKEIWCFSGVAQGWAAGSVARMREELPSPDTAQYLENLRIRRGFVGAVQMRYATWCLAYADLQSRFPLQDVELTTEPNIDAEYDSVQRLWWSVIANKIVEVPAAVMPRVRVLGSMKLLASRWPGITFSSPESRR